MGRKRFYIPDQIIVYGLILVMIVASFYVASKYIKPAPPSDIVIASGSKGGSYAKYAEEYKKLLEEERMNVKIIETKGSAENIELLKQGKVDVAFIQGGTVLADDPVLENMEALSSLYYEPLWLFVSPKLKKTDIRSLKGKRISIGEIGSGTRSLVERILEINDINRGNTKFFGYPIDLGVKAIKEGNLDAIFVVSGVNSPNIQKLLYSDDIKLVSIDRSKAYSRYFTFLSDLELPEGIVDFANNIPNEDISLIASSAMLVVNKDMHQALKKLVLHTSSKVHGDRSIFSDKGFFPTLELVDLPISDKAVKYFKDGPSLLQKYVPFWIADLLDRLKIMLIPLLAIFLPLIKVASPAYRWRVRSKIYKFYKKLRAAEDSIDDLETAEDKEKIQKLLSEMEELARDTPVPLSFTDALYNLRLHISLVYKELDKKSVKKSKKV